MCQNDNKDSEDGGIFRFDAPSSAEENESEYGVLLDVFTADKAILASFGALFVTLCFYLIVFLSGGITDGTDRFPDPVEDIRTTIQNDPDYETSRRWSPLSPFTYEEDIDYDELFK